MNAVKINGDNLKTIETIYLPQSLRKRHAYVISSRHFVEKSAGAPKSEVRKREIVKLIYRILTTPIRSAFKLAARAADEHNRSTGATDERYRQNPYCIR